MAGTNSEKGIIPSGRSTRLLEFIDGVIDALIVLTLLLKNSLNLFASSTSEEKDGKAVSWLLSSNWLTTLYNSLGLFVFNLSSMNDFFFEDARAVVSLRRELYSFLSSSLPVCLYFFSDFLRLFLNAAYPASNQGARVT